MKPTMDDVQVVLARFDETDWDELRIDAGDFHLHVFKSPRSERAERSTPPQAALAGAPVTGPAPTTTAAVAAPVPAEPASAQSPPEARVDGHVVTAPSLGTFYRAPKPGADPFVEIGGEVGADTQLCLLEVMKLYTGVQAGVAGVLVEVLVEDGALVEHGQPLFVVRPHGD